MARKSTRKRQADNRPQGGHSRKAGIWLAPLSAVVGVTRGMFTLRDQLFPSEAGPAQAVPESVYRYNVGGICDELNAAERARARELRPSSRRLRGASNTAQQRNALLDAVGHGTARSSQALAASGGAVDAATQHRYDRKHSHHATGLAVPGGVPI